MRLCTLILYLTCFIGFVFLKKEKRQGYNPTNVVLVLGPRLSLNFKPFSCLSLVTGPGLSHLFRLISNLNLLWLGSDLSLKGSRVGSLVLSVVGSIGGRTSPHGAGTQGRSSCRAQDTLAGS